MCMQHKQLHAQDVQGWTLPHPLVRHVLPPVILFSMNHTQFTQPCKQASRPHPSLSYVSSVPHLSQLKHICPLHMTHVNSLSHPCTAYDEGLTRSHWDYSNKPTSVHTQKKIIITIMSECKVHSEWVLINCVELIPSSSLCLYSLSGGANDMSYQVSLSRVPTLQQRMRKRWVSILWQPTSHA